MNDQQRKVVIPELDTFVSQAKNIEKELDYLVSRHRLYQDPALLKASSSASNLVGTLKEISSELKRANVDFVRSCVIDWHRFRVEGDIPDDEIVDPDIESICYEGNDTWRIIMTTPTHGKERVIVNSDAATWEQVYSADRM